MANANIRHEVFCFTRYNIQRILGSPKLYLILIILSCYILQLVFCPRTLDGPIQYLSIHKTNLTVLEPYILIVNGYYPLQFIMIGFILLISDAPFLEAGIGNYLIRSKRSRWFLGQFAYILFLSVIYNIFLLLITTLPFIPYLRLSTNWSPLIQNYFSLQVDTNYSLAFADTSIADTFLLFLKDISPLYAWVITMLNSLLWMTTLGIVYLTISLYSNSSLSLFVIGIFYVLEILRNGIGFFPYEFTVLNIIKTNYPVTPRQKRSRCRSNRGIIDSPTPLFTPFCRFRYRSRGQIHSHQYPRTSSTNDPFLKWFSYASRMMRIAMSTSPF